MTKDILTLADLDECIKQIEKAGIDPFYAPFYDEYFSELKEELIDSAIVEDVARRLTEKYLK